MKQEIKSAIQRQENEYYIESQGAWRDQEILGRYQVMINYFAENPERIFDNEKTLSTLYYNDVILAQDENLRSRLLGLLNLDLVKKQRIGGILTT